MNEFGKICVVFVTAASLAFMAFAGAMRSGGKDWLAEADELGEDFILNVTPGDKTSYSITYRPSGENLGNSTVLAEVVTKAWAKKVAVTRERMTKLTDQAAAITPDTDAKLKAIESDKQGLEIRIKAMTQQLDQVNAAIAKINTDINDAALEVQRIRLEGQERREEGYRLRNQLELLRNDLYVAQVQRKNLEDEELRLREILRRLERRKQQLSGTVTDDEEA